jgi:hypothetical protein
MIQTLNSEKDNLISARLRGTISKTDVEKIRSKIHNILENYDKVDFYFEMENFEGYTLKGFWEDIRQMLPTFPIMEKWHFLEKRNGRNG